MAFRTAGCWKSMVSALGASSSSSSSSSFTTSTLPKMKAYAPAAGHAHPSPSPSPGGIKSKFPKGDFFPVMMAVGMIALSASFGVLTAWHQLGRNPNLYVKKSRRETIPELVEPERVTAEAEKFLNQSFFRKVAHIQDLDRQDVMSDPIRGDAFTRHARVETLKDVGVDPAAN